MYTRTIPVPRNRNITDLSGLHQKVNILTVACLSYCRVESLSEEMSDAVRNPSYGDAVCSKPDSPRARRVTQTRQTSLIESRLAGLEYKMKQIYELLIQQSQKQGLHLTNKIHLDLYKNACA